MARNWAKIAADEFKKTEQAYGQDWADLYKRTSD
jgi:hypothetical protein